MTESPRFSVTIPAYNAEATLVETLASVQGQTFSDFEIVVVDDGSTDSTRAITERVAADDSRIRLITQENRGSGGAYNTAVRNARADLIVMLSADDLLMPEHLAAFDAFIDEHPDASIFTSGGWYEYDDGARELSTLHERWSNPAECTLEDLLAACFFGIGAVFRREVFDKLDGFNEDIYAEDYIFWLLAMAHGFTHCFLDRPLAVHRRNSAQKSADALRVRLADFRAIKEVLGTGLLTHHEVRRARQVIRRLRLNIAIRRVLGFLLGQSASTRLINRLRGIHRPRVGE